jgi:mono/diheme cytochrome c family protein
MRLRVGIVVVLSAIAVGCSATPTQPLGERTFQTHCASCHGPLAEGDGPAAATLTVPVPSLRTLSKRNGGTFPADAVASYVDGRSFPAAHGTREMPVWGPVFSVTQQLVRGAESPEQRIAGVTAFLRELQQ